MSVRAPYSPLVQSSSQPRLRTARRIVRSSVVRVRASKRARMRAAWRAAQCDASRKKERPAMKRVGTPKKKRKTPRERRDDHGQWEQRAMFYMKERNAVCVRWYKEDRGERERRV